MLPRYRIFCIWTLFLATRQAHAFNRTECLQTTSDRLKNGSLSYDSPYFYRDKPDGLPYTDPSNMTLTLAGCEDLCDGPQQTWYTDAGPRLSNWLIPVLLLLINMEVSPLGKRNFLEYLHLLGDPIDSLWSLLHKIDVWDCCHAHTEQYEKLCPSCRLIIGTVLAGHEEVLGPRLTSRPERFGDFIHRHSPVEHYAEWRRAAVELADSRTNEIMRTVLAIVLYLYQLVSNFVPAVGGPPSSPPGNRIATTVLLSCFLPAILLTNAVGSFASRRSAHSIMTAFAIRTNGLTLRVAEQSSFFLPHLQILAQVSTSKYYKALAWSGGTDIYRPWKFCYANSSLSSFCYTLTYGMFTAIPLVIGTLGGSLILWWQTPRGFNCRHIWLITVSLLWIASAVITQLSYTFRLATGKYHWRLVLVKDACVAFPTFIIFFLSASGLFNSCWCWSGPWRYRGTGRVVLPVTYYLSNGRIMYPMTLGAALLLQLLFVAFVVCIWKRGFGLLRWNEDTLQRQSNRVLSEAPPCRCMSNFQPNRNINPDTEAQLLKSDEN